MPESPWPLLPVVSYSNHIPWFYMKSGKPGLVMEQWAPYWQQKGHGKISWTETQRVWWMVSYWGLVKNGSLLYFSLQEEPSCFPLIDAWLRFCCLEAEPKAGFLCRWWGLRTGVRERPRAGKVFSKDVISFSLIPWGAVEHEQDSRADPVWHKAGWLAVSD